MQSLYILNLSANQLQGEIPRCLCELHSLTKLDISHNHLQGDIGACFSNMSSIRYLDISDNHFNGSFPSLLLHNITNIETLIASDNQFQGDIGACFSNMSSIRYLDISNNHFNGSFPSLLLHNITNIETLIASHNQFTDNISFSMFANLSKLSYLDLSFNDHLEVETESPAWFPSFNLNGLFLGGCNLNKYSGSKIPSFISTQYNLISLDLSYNSLAGSIPSWLLYNGTSMLRLRGNKLSGSFPLPNGNMSSNLTLLDISENLFHGPIPLNINIILPMLHTLNLASNRFHGEIPNMASLEYLLLSNNSFQGKILPGNSSFPKLKVLFLRGNNFNEMNSRSLSTCSSLQFLDAAENSLSGDLSTQLPLLTNLKVIVLRRNHFDGRIPEHLCQMQGLQVLDIAENNLSDIIPFCLNNITSWKGQHFSDYQGVRLSYVDGDMPVPLLLRLTVKGYEIQLSRLINIFYHIDVSSNQLTGTIPFQMGDLRAITILNVSNNLLTGHIPSSLGNWSDLESLDLSNNKLCGQIPRELVDLQFLEVFSVAFNNMSGQIPQGSTFDTFVNSSYEGNPGLCGHPLERACSPNIPAATYTDGASREAYIFIFWCLVLHIM